MRLRLLKKLEVLFRSPFVTRRVMAVLAAILLVGLFLAYHFALPRVSGHLEHPEFLAIGLLLIICTFAMIFWFTLGVFGGMAVFLAAFIFLNRPLSRLNPNYFYLLIIVFFLSSFLGYFYYRKIALAKQDQDLDLEKLEEEINLIANHLKRRSSGVEAMGGKIVNLLKLKNIADSLSLSLSDKEVMQIVAEETLLLMECEPRVMLFIYDSTRKEFFLSHTSKNKKRKVFPRETGGTFGRWVQKNMKSLLVKNIHRDFRFSVEEKEMSDDAVSVMIKPLLVENRILGILRVDSDKEDAFGQYHLRLLDIIGGLASVSLENAKLYRQTKNLAIKDSLTGLFVYRYFMERLEEEVKRALHVKSSFALFLIDIDGFKDFNDEHGHITGDAMLKKVASVLRSKISPGDFVARYGGEEFAFVSLNTQREEAIRLAEDIRDEVASSPIEIRRQELSVTVSIGVSIFPEDARFKREIIENADNNLYKAKKEGKNRVCAE